MRSVIRNADAWPCRRALRQTGQLLDQAALFGVLNSLYDRRLPLLLVEYVPEEIPEALEE